MNYDYKNLRPFKWFVLQNFPFIEVDFDAITNWQLFCKLGEEINKLIASENLTGQQVENLTNAFNSLQAYVNNYFDNLDIQAEVNEKLDEMAESGELADIIAQYLNTQVLICFDTVADMIASELLARGSYARTLGFNTINDGGANIYKIIEEQSVEDYNNYTKISLHRDDLYAVPLSDTINVKQFGVKGDGITDDTTAIQFIMDNFVQEGKTIYFPNGKYLISSPITVPIQNRTSIKLDNQAEVFTNTDIDSLFIINGGASYFMFDGGFLNGNNHANYCIKTGEEQQFSSTYKNITLRNAKVCCLRIKNPDNTQHSEHGSIYNLSIQNNLVPSCIGMEIYSNDYKIVNSEIFYVSKGIICTGLLTITNCHIWAGGELQLSNNTIGIEFTGDRIMATQLYLDGMNTGIDTKNTNATISLDNCIALYPAEGTYNNSSLIKNGKIGRNLISNLSLYATEDNVTVLNESNFNMEQHSNYQTRISNSQIQFLSGTQENINLIDLADNIYVKTDRTALVKGHYEPVTNNNYYDVGYLVLRSGGVSSFNLLFTLDDEQKYSQNLKVCVYSEGTVAQIFTSTSVYNTSNAFKGKYGIALGTPEVKQDISGNSYVICKIYLKVVENFGNQYAVNCVAESGSQNNIVGFYKYFKSTPVSQPSILQEWTDNT